MPCPTQAIIDETLVFSVNTRSGTTGEPTDADSVPEYSVFEDETATAILTGTMTKLVGSKDGFYTEKITTSEANGFETAKTYTILVEVVVGGVHGNISYNFMCLDSSSLPSPSVPSGTIYGFTTIDSFSQKLSAVAADHNIEWNSDNTTIMVRRLQQSYSEILDALMGRGLTGAQVDSWRRGEEYQLDIATFWYGRDYGWGSKVEEERDWIKVFDRRAELRTMSIFGTDGSLLTGNDKTFGLAFDLETINSNLGYNP